MSRRYKAKAKADARELLTNFAYDFNLLMRDRPDKTFWMLQRVEGQRTHQFQMGRCFAKLEAAHQRLIRRVYQTGEWWLLSDPYEQYQAERYFAITRS